MVEGTGCHLGYDPLKVLALDFVLPPNHGIQRQRVKPNEAWGRPFIFWKRDPEKLRPLDFLGSAENYPHSFGRGPRPR